MELQLVLLAHIVGICSGLRDVRLQIPTAVKNGDAAILNCWYDTEGDALYTVKWYKDAREFYRYTPKDNPPVKTFAIPSLKVNKSESNATQVAVTEVDLDSAGTYSCEVSADAPSFQTAIVMATMNIVELPKRRPSIHGLKSKYRINDDLHGNCTSDWSKPAANLTWFVNDRQVISHGDERHTDDSNHPYGPDWLQPLQAHVRHYSPAEMDFHGQISKIGIRFRVTPQHFSSGKLKIRCSASIYDIYWQSTEVSAEEDRPRVIHFEPAATIVGINYLQPPPNFQTGQKKPDGQVGVKVIGSSSSMDLRPSLRFVLESFVLLLLAIR